MPPPHPKHPPAPEPTRVIFDPFNSSSTGHQRAENRLSGSTSWRQSRTYKLARQFGDASGGGGKQHLSDLVGAGSENFRKDGRRDNGPWGRGAPGLREKGWQDIRVLMGGSRKRGKDDGEGGGNDDEVTKRWKSNEDEAQQRKVIADEGVRSENDRRPSTNASDKAATTSTATSTTTSDTSPPPPPQIFHSLTLYLNGSTAPLISDYKLKSLFTQHGGTISLSLARRSVTHVVLGTSAAGGGGLAGGKIQKEIAQVRGLGNGVKYVTAQWVLESVKRGRRQAEARYMPEGVEGRLGGAGQRGVLGMLKGEGKT